MQTIKINSYLKFILIGTFLFSGFQSFGTKIKGGKCSEGFSFPKDDTLKENSIQNTSLERSFGYSFKNQKLKLRVLTRRNRLNLKTYYKHNSLEFLGDAVFGLFVAELLVRRYPRANKKQLYDIWSFLVSNHVFAEWALTLKLDQHILDRDIRARANNVRYNETQDPYLTLADFLEALVGAVYLDGGYREAKKLVLRLVNLSKPGRNYIIFLSEVTSKRFQENPVYEITEIKDPSHNTIFFATVRIGNKFMGSGKGTRKKTAMQMAALDTLNKLNITTSLMPTKHPPSSQPLTIKFPGLSGMNLLNFSSYNFHYNRLNFLGHAVFNLHLASVLLEQHIYYKPKDLIKRKKLLKNFIELSNLPDKLQLAIIEVLNKKPLKERNLYDSFYFLLGAIYLEKGYEATEVLVTNLLEKSELLKVYEYNQQAKKDRKEQTRASLHYRIYQ